MSMFKVSAIVRNTKDESKISQPVEVLVDTGSGLSWLPGDVLTGIEVAPLRKRNFTTATKQLVTRETGQKKFHFIGESSGALRAGAYAMVAPDRIDRLVFAAFTYKGEGSPTLAKRAEQLAYFRTHNMRKRDREMIRSIATRDKPGTSDPAAIEALADAEMVFGDQIPTGTYLDMTANLPVVHPEKVLAPVLLVRGEHDGIATVADLEEFFNLLPNGDRQFIILPGTAHSVALATNRQLFWHVTRAFLTMPTPIAT